jgi:uncharacterized protein (UPF0332 family)
MTIFNIPRQERTPETEVDILLSNLSALYSEIHPDAPPYEFINVDFKEYFENEHTSGDVLARMVDEIYPVNAAGVGKVTEEAAMAVSLAYCVQAQKAYDDGKLNEAWTYIIDARFWCDKALSRHKGINLLLKAEHVASVKAIKQESRRKGVAKYDHSQFITNEYRLRKWKNKTEATKVINEKLKAHIEANGLPKKKIKSTNEKGDFLETWQEDFYNLVWDKLPGLKQFKMDQDSFIKNSE